MIIRYEIAFSTGPDAKTLVFPEGTFEALPFEVRLMEPWYGCDYIDSEKLKPSQRHEIMRRGFTLIREGEHRVRDAA